MIARHAQCCAGAHHAHDELEYLRHFRTTVDQITSEDRPPSCGWRDGARSVDAVGQLRQQSYQIVVTAVAVTNDVEGTLFLASIIPQGLARNDCVVDLLDRRENEDMTKALPL